MRVNNFLISIPPYISSHWANISSIHTEDSTLIICLDEGTSIKIPDLTKVQIDKIFKCHLNFLVQDEKETQLFDKFQPSQSIVSGVEFFPKVGFGAIDQFGAPVQHNPDNANMPDMPAEILDKISSIVKIMGPEDPSNIPQAEPHCNCMFCQIAKAVALGLSTSKTSTNHSFALHDEFNNESNKQLKNVTEKELITSEKWDIAKIENQLYRVTSKIDTKENYNVFLGSPIKCTCGKEGCEHIIQVLKS